MRSAGSGGGWVSGEAALLRIYVMAGDHSAGRPLADALVQTAREAGILGATVIPGIAGFGRSGCHGNLEVLLHDPAAQPLVVELADAEAQLRAFLPVLASLDTRGCLATIERLDALSYHPGGHTEP